MDDRGAVKPGGHRVTARPGSSLNHPRRGSLVGGGPISRSPVLSQRRSPGERAAIRTTSGKTAWPAEAAVGHVSPRYWPFDAARRSCRAVTCELVRRARGIATRWTLSVAAAALRQTARRTDRAALTGLVVKENWPCGRSRFRSPQWKRHWVLGVAPVSTTLGRFRS